MGSGRRTFLKHAGIASATWATGASARADAADRLSVGIIGTGGMGTNHLQLLAARKDIGVAAVCDVDAERLAAAAGHVESATGKRPQATPDLRRVLDDPKIAAVFIATPDHWHAPAALLALAAGKHVYVEKPLCHNVREGRLLVEAVERSGKLLQVGTQSRSSETVRDAIGRVLDGAIGEVLVAKAWNSQRRGSIGKSKPSKPPAQLDFDAWLGPAPQVAYRPNLLHSVWRWWRDFGCGDIGNDGVHDLDVALWGLGVDTHPSTITCLGGKYVFDDDQQFPDTQYAVFEYPRDGKPDGRKKQLVFEQRIWSPYVQEGYENGAAFYGTEGMLVIGHSGGWKLYGPRNALIAERTGPADLAAHHTNFLDAVRGTGQPLNADVAVGHRAAAVVHLANIAARLGRVLRFDPATERVEG
nr:Gfo/Idh/MocA family oxidoreductase [Planctomycetota bacterium]